MITTVISIIAILSSGMGMGYKARMLDDWARQRTVDKLFAQEQIRKVWND